MCIRDSEVSDYYMNLKGGGAGDAPLPLKRKKVKDVILCRISTNDTNVCKLFTGCPRSAGLPLAKKPFFKKLKEAIKAARPKGKGGGLIVTISLPRRPGDAGAHG